MNEKTFVVTLSAVFWSSVVTAAVCVQYISRQCAISAQSVPQQRPLRLQHEELMWNISFNLRCFAELFSRSLSLNSERSRTFYMHDCSSVRIWQIPFILTQLIILWKSMKDYPHRKPFQFNMEKCHSSYSVRLQGS